MMYILRRMCIGFYWVCWISLWFLGLRRIALRNGGEVGIVFRLNLRSRMNERYPMKVTSFRLF